MFGSNHKEGYIIVTLIIAYYHHSYNCYASGKKGGIVGDTGVCGYSMLGKARSCTE